MQTRLKPEEFIPLEEELNKTFQNLYPESSGTLYCPGVPPEGIMMEGETGYRVCFLQKESTIQIPLILENELLGIFLLKDIRVEALENQGNVLGQVADLCLQNFLLSKEKQNDPLTGLLNRSAFIFSIEQSIELAARYLLPGGPSFELTPSESRPDLSLLLVAVHNLGHLQKEYGFSFGDSVLCSVAGELQGLCPEQGILSRCGDRVLGVLIPGIGAVQSKKTAVKLLRALNNRSFSTPVLQEKITIQAGIGLSNYPQDLHGSQLRTPAYEKARALLANAFHALDRGRVISPQEVFPFSKILTHGGAITHKPSLDRVRLNLGYLHRAVEGMRFSVFSQDQGRAPHPGEGDHPKGEIMLVEVGAEESLAEILFLNEPRQEIVPGDVLLQTGAGEREVAPRAGKQGGSRILAFHSFLRSWQQDREHRDRFSLILIRVSVAPEIGPSETGTGDDPLLQVEHEVRSRYKTEAALGRYGSWGLILYLPGIGPDEARETARKISACLAQAWSVSPAVGIASYPCLDATRDETLSNCRKALIHAQLLDPPRIACFDSQTLTISGDRFYAQNDLPGACTEYNLALVLDPQNTTARNSLGICLARLGRINRAAAQFKKVLSLEPENSLARYNFGHVCLKTGNREEGIKSFEHCLRLDPDHVFSLLRLGLLAAEDHDLNRARECFLRAVEIPEGKKYAFRLLGKLDLREDDPEQGRTNLHLALTHNPHDAEAMHLLARLYFDDGQDLEIAESLARKSSALRPERLDFVELLDEILLRQGKEDQARLLLSRGPGRMKCRDPFGSDPQPD